MQVYIVVFSLKSASCYISSEIKRFTYMLLLKLCNHLAIFKIGMHSQILKDRTFDQNDVILKGTRSRMDMEISFCGNIRFSKSMFLKSSLERKYSHRILIDISFSLNHDRKQ